MMDGSWVRSGLWIEPLDPLLFRGGRPFGPASRAESGLPNPQTLAGALRTALLAAAGFDFAAWAARRRSGGPSSVKAALLEFQPDLPPGLTEVHFRGPWLAQWPEGQERPEPLLPIPLNLYRQASDQEREGIWTRADPLEGDLPGWRGSNPARRPLWHRGGPDAKRPVGFLSLDGIRSYLEGGTPSDSQWKKPSDLYDFDDRTGLEIDAETLTGVEGRLYATRLLAPRPKVGFYAEILTSETVAGSLRTWLDGPFPWGGERRYARATVREKPVDWPCVAAPEGRRLWLLATPAPPSDAGRRGGYPDQLTEADLVGIASGSAVSFSGWDIARGGPRPTRFASPAGSVYFTNSPDGTDTPRSLCDDAEDVAQGWGFALPGVWNHAR